MKTGAFQRQPAGSTRIVHISGRRYTSAAYPEGDHRTGDEQQVSHIDLRTNRVDKRSTHSFQTSHALLGSDPRAGGWPRMDNILWGVAQSPEPRSPIYWGRRGNRPPRRDLEGGCLLGSRFSGVGGMAGAGAIGPFSSRPPARARRGAGAVERGGVEMRLPPCRAVPSYTEKAAFVSVLSVSGDPLSS